MPEIVTDPSSWKSVVAGGRKHGDNSHKQERLTALKGLSRACRTPLWKQSRGLIEHNLLEILSKQRARDSALNALCRRAFVFERFRGATTCGIRGERSRFRFSFG